MDGLAIYFPAGRAQSRAGVATRFRLRELRRFT